MRDIWISGEGIGENPFIIKKGVNGDCEIGDEINGGVFEVMEVRDIKVVNDSSDAIFTLVIGEKSVMITGDKKSGGEGG